MGASPDGITKDGVMLEIKCPYRRTITGVPPIYYVDQVQGQLEVCELDRCDFLECKLEETKEDLYFASNFENNYFYNNLGLEKGIIAVYLNRKTKKVEFEYSELGINKEQFNEWKKTVKFINDDNYVFVEYTFWNLLQVSCIPIYRE